MDPLLTVLIVGALAVGTALALVRRTEAQAELEERQERRLPGAAEETGEPPLEERALEQLRSGDAVLLQGGEDFVVQGVAMLEDGARRYCLALLDAGAGQAWLLMPGARPEWVALGRAERLPLLPGERPSTELELEGQIYRLRRRGRAEVSLPEGSTPAGLPPGRLSYWEYGAAGPARLWLLQGGEQSLALALRRYPRHQVSTLPGG